LKKKKKRLPAQQKQEQLMMVWLPVQEEQEQVMQEQDQLASSRVRRQLVSSQEINQKVHLKALTDHLGGGSRVDSFDPHW
jgi:hypothetical protein